MSNFDSNGNYNKTNWKTGDKITADKLNKIEDGIEVINNNDISRHEETDARLDALEAGVVANKQEIDAKVDALEDTVASNKDATNLDIYRINQHMTLLDKKIDEGVAQVNDAKNEMTTQVNDAKAEILNIQDELIAQVNTAKAEMTTQINNAKTEMNTQVNNAKNEMFAYADNAKSEMAAQVNTTKDEMTAQVNQGKADMEAMVAEVEGELGKKVNNFYGTNNVGKILMVGEDGYLVIDDAPAGAGGGSYPVVGTVDDDNVITLSSDELVDGLYTLRYSDGVEYKPIGTVLVGERIATSITATKGKTTYEIGETLTTNDIVVTAHFNDLTSEVVTGYTVDSSSVKMNAEGNYTIIITYENCTTSIPIAVMDMRVTGNLFVASTCTLGKRVSSSGEIKDQTGTFLTDYIEIGNCMAIGGENIIHWQGFHMYKLTSAEISNAGVDSNSIGAYRGVGYYDATGKFLGQDTLYVTEKAYDSEGNYQLVLNASYTTATKIRIFAVTLPPATSVSELSNCKLTLNQLISEI